VSGVSNSGNGVYGESESGVGVSANVGASAMAAVFGNSNGGPGLWAQTDGVAAGVVGWSKGSQRTGVLGFSGTGSVPTPIAKTGVYGRATQDANSRGVYGYSTGGQGVRGQATTGTAGYFATPVVSDLHTGTALVADGRVKFPNCVGVASFAQNATSVVVTPGIVLTSTSAAVATITGASVGVSVVRTRANTTANTFTIFLSGPASAAGKVAWHVFG
jgi:hypothetical protein